MLRLKAAAAALLVAVACGTTTPPTELHTAAAPLAVVPADSSRPPFPTVPPAPPTTTTTVPPTTTTAPPPPPPEPVVRAAAAAPPQESAGACGGWGELIAAHFPTGQVPKACAVMLCESKGNPGALNTNPRYEAAGLFQIIKQWAADFATVTGVPYYDGRFDPTANVRFAAWLWGQLGWSQWQCA